MRCILCSLLVGLAAGSAAWADDVPDAPTCPAPEPFLGGPGRADMEGPFRYFHANIDYLLWWTKKGSAPPLVTTGPAGTAAPGVLGQNGTGVLFGGPDGLDYRDRSGIQAGLGGWFDLHQTFGLEAGGLVLENRPVTFFAASDLAGNPVLARPLVNAVTGAETAAYVALPGSIAGNILIFSPSRLWGADMDLVWRPAPACPCAVSLLSGFRYLALDEQIGIRQTTMVLPGGVLNFGGMPLAAGDTVQIEEGFAARTRFYGGQLGARGEYQYGCAFAEVTGKVAAGVSHEMVSVGGLSSLLSRPGVGTAAGVLALASNRGNLERDEFAVVPEVGVRAGCLIGLGLRLSVGYQLLYWEDVVRPGDVINRVQNPAQLPLSPLFGTPGGPAAPAAVIPHGHSFWAQGLTFGVEYRF